MVQNLTVEEGETYFLSVDDSVNASPQNHLWD